MCEKVGPNPILEQVFSAMSSSKKPLQQKAVLQWLCTVVDDFGAMNLSTKNVLAYLQRPQALTHSNPDIKSAAVAVLVELHRQLGPAVDKAVEHFEIPELQLRAIRDKFAETP